LQESLHYKSTYKWHSLSIKNKRIKGRGAFSPEFVGGDFPKLVKLDLLGEDIEWDVDRPSEAAATLVVVEDGVKTGPVSVEEVLVAQRVEVSNAAGRIPEQRVWKLVERSQLRLEPQSAHLRNAHTNQSHIIINRSKISNKHTLQLKDEWENIAKILKKQLHRS